MKNIRPLGIVLVLTLSASLGTANATTISADPASVPGHAPSYAQPSVVSPASDADDELAWDVSGYSGPAQQGEKVAFFRKSPSSESPDADTKISLWLFLLVAAVFGIVSELLHHLTGTR
jgi:hypothetical protein